MHNWSKYIFVFLLTCGIFAASWYLSAYFNQKKITEIRSIQDKVAIDLMSSETQFDLLEEMSCQDIGNSVLNQELASLAGRISYSEQNVGAAEEIRLLKQQYTILQVKDFLLSKRIGERCKKTPVTILYFYGDKDACTDCVKQGYVLDALREKYPDVRVYSFDYELDSSTVRALNSIYKVTGNLPALVVDGKKTINGFRTLEQIEALLPKSITNPPKELVKKPAASAATVAN